MKVAWDDKMVRDYLLLVRWSHVEVEKNTEFTDYKTLSMTVAALSGQVWYTSHDNPAIDHTNTFRSTRITLAAEPSEVNPLTWDLDHPESSAGSQGSEVYVCLLALQPVNRIS